jgi:hypothetical protein
MEEPVSYITLIQIGRTAQKGYNEGETLTHKQESNFMSLLIKIKGYKQTHSQKGDIIKFLLIFKIRKLG